MQSFKRILAVIDDPRVDQCVLDRIQAIATPGQSDIELFSCLYDELIASERAFDGVDLDQFKRRYLDAHAPTLASLADNLTAAGHTVTTHLAWDKPIYQGIVRRVLEWQPDLVIRAGRFHAPIERAVLSNDDWSLVRTCPAPLLVARQDHVIGPKPAVWAAIDPVHEHDKPCSLDRSIVDAAQAMAQALNGMTQIVHTYDTAPALAKLVNRTMGSSVVPKSDLATTVRSHHTNAVAEFTAGLDIAAHHIHVVPGAARETLPAMMIDQNADVLVVGCVARSRISRAIIGHTAERLLNRTPCDLLVIKPDTFETPIKAVSKHRLAS